MLAIIAARLLSCPLCRWAALSGLAVAAAWLAWRRARASGAKAERLAQQQASFEARLVNLKEKRDAETEAGRRSVVERRQRVQRYGRPD